MANIKSSERRKLIGDIAKTYDVPEELASSLLPPSIKKATYKSPLKHSGNIYADEEHIPLYFKSRDSDITPTVFTLWRIPNLLPAVLTNSFVISKLENGADLMLPGTIPPFDKRCTKGALVGIVDYEAPLVVRAIGVCELDLTKFTSTNNRTGVAVRILHHYGDELKKICKKPLAVPNNDAISVLLQAQVAKDEEAHNDQEATEENKALNEEVTALTNEAERIAIDNTHHHAEVEETGTQQSVTPKMEEDNQPEEVQTLQTGDIDYLFKRAFLMTLHQGQVETPVSASQFMSNYVLKNLPSVTESLEHLLVMKKTSWKKSTKFFKEMEKAKYLKLKGKDENLTVLEVANKDNNDEIKNFVPHKIKKAAGSNGSINTQNNNAGSGSNKIANKLNILTLYKPNSKIREFFSMIEEDYNYYYNGKEIAELMNKYISKKDLVNPRNKRTVVLDDLLTNLLITNRDQGRVFPRDKIVPHFLKYFTECYKILGSDESPDEVDLLQDPPIKGSVPKIKIISEYKLGRKIITRTSNFENYNIVTPNELAQYLKLKCSGSTTIGSCKENPKLQEVTVQGPHISTVTKFFTEHGVSPLYIESADRTKSKKKR